jgi:hypothetical protein
VKKQETSGLISGRSFRGAQGYLSTRSPVPTVTELCDFYLRENPGTIKLMMQRYLLLFPASPIVLSLTQDINRYCWA